MRIFLLVLAGLLCCSCSMAGTLIYKNNKGDVKRASGLKIQTIDRDRMVVRIGSGTEVIHLSRVVKYYDTDIKLNGDFDDDSGEYTVRLSQPTMNQPKKGGRKELLVPYSIVKNAGVKMGAKLRQPYFYLFILCSNDETYQRKVVTSCFPQSARASMKGYDEAKMLEKVLAMDRPDFYSADASIMGMSKTSRRMGGSREAKIPLNSLRNDKVIAWYLVVWGKDSIVATESWREPGRNIGKNWWIR